MTETVNQKQSDLSPSQRFTARWTRSSAELRYLPPYSPDFNPIQMAFSKLKALLRKAAAWSMEGLWDAIGNFLELFQPEERRNYFNAAGYDPT
jgi:transposase